MIGLYWRIIIRPRLWQIALVGVGTIVISILEVLSIGLLIPLIDQATNADQPGRDSGFGFLWGTFGKVFASEEPTKITIAILVAIAILISVKGVIELGIRRKVGFLSTYIANSFLYRMFQGYLLAPYTEVTRRGRGAIIQNLEVVTDEIRRSVSIFGTILYSLAYIVAILAFLLYLSWWATLIVGTLVSAGVFTLRKVLEDRAHRIGSKMMDLNQQRSKLLVDSLDGIRIVKIHNKAKNLGEELKENQIPLERLNARYQLVSSVPGTFFECVGVISGASMIGVALIFPKLGLNLSELAAMLLAFRRLLPNVSALNSGLVDMARKLRQMEILDEVLFELPKEDPGNRPLPPGSPQRIKFSDVSFRYPDRKSNPVLQEIDFELKRGDVTALVGTTGGGKSTAADLLGRIIEPTSGRIEVDGVDLSDIDLTGWRNCIGYVSQDPFLFNASIADNIVMWDRSISRERVEQVGEQAQLNEFVRTLPEGYDTVVGDRGLRLSGGQGQRVAIARAIAHRPPLLIFDEATSSLDNRTERDVHRAIAQLRENTIIFVIAHRLSTVRDADQIVVLEKGVIAELGSHEGLMALRGQYYTLYLNREKEVDAAG